MPLDIRDRARLNRALAVYFERRQFAAATRTDWEAEAWFRDMSVAAATGAVICELELIDEDIESASLYRAAEGDAA